jgi:hypothetical protein
MMYVISSSRSMRPFEGSKGIMVPCSAAICSRSYKRVSRDFRHIRRVAYLVQSVVGEAIGDDCEALLLEKSLGSFHHSCVLHNGIQSCVERVLWRGSMRLCRSPTLRCARRAFASYT